MAKELRLQRGGYAVSEHLVRGCAQVGGGERGDIVGWSAGAAGRNSDFLRSVDWRDMPGGGYAVTLTLRGLPSPDEWAQLVQRLCWWLTKRGTRRNAAKFAAHMVTEWQWRGAPHLHLAVWGVKGADVVDWWLAHTAQWGTLRRAQESKRIRTPAVWAAYVSKHGQRGVQSYQRSRDTLVGEWRERSAGKLWRKFGAAWAAAVKPERVYVILGDGFERWRARFRKHLKAGEWAFMRGFSAWGQSMLFAWGLELCDPATGEVLCAEQVTEAHSAEYLRMCNASE